MERYFYHISNGNGYTRDDEGQELPPDRTVRDVALLSVRSLIGDELMTGTIDLKGRIEVTDAEGACVLQLPFIEAVEILR